MSTQRFAKVNNDHRAACALLQLWLPLLCLGYASLLSTLCSLLLARCTQHTHTHTYTHTHIHTHTHTHLALQSRMSLCSSLPSGCTAVGSFILLGLYFAHINAVEPHRAALHPVADSVTTPTAHVFSPLALVLSCLGPTPISICLTRAAPILPFCSQATRR